MPTKACLYNLLAVSKDPERLKKVEPLFTDLLERFPGRLVTLLEKSGEKQINIEELPSVALTGSKVVTESRIAITVSGYDQKMISLVPLPYLIPDLPIFLFWLDDHFDTPLFQELHAMSDRLLLNGEETRQFQEWFQKLSSDSLPVVDLAWCRGDGWRSVMREILSSEHRRHSLDKCRLLQISYAKGPITNALFFQAWLATALGFSFKEKKLDGDVLELIYDWQGNKIDVFLSPKEDPTSQPGSILNLQFTSSEGEQCLIFRGDDALEVKVHITTADTCDIPFTVYLPNPKRGGSFLPAWIWGNTSKEMRETLPLLKKIIE